MYSKWYFSISVEFCDFCDQAQNQKADIDDVTNEVKQMSLDSIDMSSVVPSIDMTTVVPGYRLMPDPDLLHGNFVDQAAIQAPGPQDQNFFDADFATDPNVGVDNELNQFDAGGFPATIDANMWSQLGTKLDDAASGTFDFSDLILFQ